MNTTVIELYGKKDVDVSDRLTKAKHGLEEQVSRLKNLELEAQAELKKANELGPIISEVYVELLYPDRVIWEHFLPKTYSKKRGHWSDYRFDTIPEKVLLEIDKVEEIGYFDDLEIWTPEVSQIDPLLVGVLDDKKFMIARWGESLLEFSKIVLQAVATRSRFTQFSNLSGPVQKFIVDNYCKSPELSFYVKKQFFSWHCKKPAQKVVLSKDGYSDSIAHSVCTKCGSYSDGKEYYISE